MSFYSDWIDQTLDLFKKIESLIPEDLMTYADDDTPPVQGRNQAAVLSDTVKMTHLKHLPASVRRQASVEVSVAVDTIKCMQKSKIIKIPDHQLQVFMDIPLDMSQNFELLNTPFPSIFLDVMPALIFRNFYDGVERIRIPEIPIKAVMITETTNKLGYVYLEDGHGHQLDLTFKKAWRLCLFIPLKDHPENTFTVTFGVMEDGSICAPAAQYLDPETSKEHTKFMHMAIHVMNYLTSPSLILERKEHSFALQKARVKRKKPPLPDWYEIRYAQTRQAAPGATGEGSKHAFRYDVRGHFKRVKIGKLAGRSIWTPAHQRGLANETYKPKTYRIGEAK